MEMGREVAAADWVVPHSCVVDKNQEGYLRSKQTQLQTRPLSPGFQHQQHKSPQILAVKTSGDWDGRRTVGLSGNFA